MTTPIRSLSAAAGAFALALSAHAAEPWSFIVEPYAMMPNMNGDAGVGQQPPVHIDEDPSDIFDNLQWGAMLYLEARNELWAFSSDVLYMDLKGEAPIGIPPVAQASLEPEQLGWELAALRRLTPEMEVGLAATYNDIKTVLELTPTGGTTQRFSVKEDWIDPSVVMRLRYSLGNDWALVARGNIGGFGVGSDLFWQLQAHATYSISERVNFSAGYRYISVDYKNGSGPDRFVYDMDSFGPVFRFAWVF